MQPNVATAFVLFALVLVAILRWRMAEPIAEDAAPQEWPGSGDQGTEIQQPQSDRAPRRWPIGLSAAVAVTAALRVALLVTLHA